MYSDPETRLRLSGLGTSGSAGAAGELGEIVSVFVEDRGVGATSVFVEDRAGGRGR